MLLLWLACVQKKVEIAHLEAEVARLEAENAQLQAELDEVNGDLETRLVAVEEKVAQWDALLEMAGSFMGTGSSSSAYDESSYTRTPGTDDGTRCTEASGHWTVPRGAVSEDGLRTFRVVPHKGPDGELDGMRVSAIRRGSLAESCGFKNGDVVHSVNGHPMTGTQGALDAYKAVMADEQLKFLVTRRGEGMEILVVPVQAR